MYKTYGNNKSAHLYEVEVVNKDGVREKVDVHANSRGQARKIAEQYDFVVCYVNMIG